MAGFDPATYDTVADRLKKFWAEHPNGAVRSEIISEMSTIERVVYRAEVWYDKSDPMPSGVDCAYGEIDPSNYKNVDHKSWHENASTSAIGRALANCTYLAKKDSPRPSREEMEKSGAFDREARPQTRSGPAPAPVSDGSGERFPDRAPRGTKTANVVEYFRKNGFKGDGGVAGMIAEVEQTYNVKVAGSAPDGGWYPSDAYNALAYYIEGGDNEGKPEDDIPF